MGFELKTYLENKLIEQFNNKYDSYYCLYFISEESIWNGFSNFNSQFGFILKAMSKARFPMKPCMPLIFLIPLMVYIFQINILMKPVKQTIC